MAKVFLLVGFIGQFVLIMVSSISFLVLERFGVKATWTQAPFYLVVPGAYLVSLIRKPQAMEDMVELSLSFVLNAIIFTAIWFAVSFIWRRFRSKSLN
jgi:hypothetical protein